MNKKINNSKITVIALALCLFLVISYFQIFEAENLFHKCSGHDCAVCHELQVAETIIKQLSGAILTVVFCLPIVLSINTSHLILRVLRRQRNLILDKVRMDD